jgi:murein DD-endopeptidase MepM/ murein hydrolase activator NlpD
MAHGFVSYSKPKYGNLSGYIADKIKSAAGMAAEERKARDEEIKSLQKKEELTDEEQERLDFLTEQQGGRKGSFFGKALAAEFGGDRARRLKGTFSKDPSKENDPALSKGERFSALLDKPDAPAEEPVKPETPYTQLSLPGMGAEPESGDIKESLSKIFSTILKSYDTIADRVSAVGSAERENVSKSDKRNNFLASISSGLASFKDYFSTDNKLKEKELDTEVKQLEFAIDQQENAESIANESKLEAGQDLSTTVGYEDPYAKKEKEGDDGGGILGSIGNLLKNFLPKGGKVPGKGGGKFGALKNIAGSFGKGGMSPTKMSEGGVISPVKKEAPKKVEAANNIKKLSKGGIVPSPKAKPEKTKMAAGGIVDNPTVTNLNPGDAVVPLNRNNAMGKMFQSAGSSASRVMADPLAKVMQLPSQVGGGLMMGLLSQGMEKLGGIANFFKPAIMKIATPLAQMFGLPATIISSFFGGPAAAATMDFDPSKYMGTGGDSTAPGGAAPSSPAPPPGGSGGVGPGMTASGGSKASGNITSGFGNRSSPGGIGSTNHGGIDIAGGAWVQGAPVSVIKPGTVEETGDLGKSGWGKYVVVKHDDKTHSLYGHLSQINVKKGDKIENKAGAARVIGKIGSTGASTGPHLHFELGSGWNGTITGKMDPAPYVDNYIRGGGNVMIDAPVMAAGAQPAPAGTPVQPNRPPARAAKPAFAGLTLPSAQPPQQQAAAPMGLNAAFGLTNPTGIYNNYYNGW